MAGREQIIRVPTQLAQLLISLRRQQDLSQAALAQKAGGQWPEQELRLAKAWHGSTSRPRTPMQVQLRQLNSTASRMGLGAEAEALVASLVARTPEVIATAWQELPSDLPEPLADAILEGLQGSAKRLEKQLC